MTLHEAIEKLLQQNGQPMTTQQIADELNKNNWYQKKDNSKITAFQIHGRTKNYPTLFNRNGSIVSLIGQNEKPVDTTKKSLKLYDMGEGEIDEILSLFDSKMIASGKKYLPLRTANEILSESSKFKNVNLKEELKSGKISNAYQTDATPRQWRIPYSDINKYAERRKEYLRNNPKEQTQVILPTSQKKNYGCLILVAIAIAIVYFASTSSDNHKSENDDLKSEACIISQEFVTKQLLSPKSAEFGPCFKDKVKYLGDDRYFIKNYVDASNEFGVIIRKAYYVRLKFNKGDWTDINNWTLEDINIEE